MMDKYDVLKMKTCVLNIHCVCEGCKRRIKLLLQKVDGVYTVFIDEQGGRVKVTGNFDTHNLTKKLEKSAKCSEMIEAEKSSHSSVKSAPQSERSHSGNSKARGSHKSQNSVKSGGEAQSHKGSKAPTSSSMENKSVKMLDLTDLESKRSGKSRVSENGGGKKGGLFGFGKFLGFGKNGGEKGPKPCSEKSRSERGGETVHGGSIKKGSSRKDDFHGSEVAHSAGGSSRGGSKKSSKKSQMSHHSEEQASRVDDIPLVQDHEPFVGRSSRGGSKKGSKTGTTSHHSGEKASQVDREQSVAGNSSVSQSSRGGSEKGSKSGPMSHHSGEKRSQMGDPYNQQHLPMATMMNQQRWAYYDAPHLTMSPPPPPMQRESYEHYFSDENANGCNVM